ncbi:hypothetical protein HELRODRAFT_154397 [Helobdella robusta]|uniref:palmitoyl-protein hydrolase n=1 Tax=Helobdella robusta TaxID=6412 RepID=T1ELE7_HELRO|nr:hypothetical protein HELRODRAFT_154397 [Helobdella robusta]ESO11676.1 hypothetical protein HELRODRAFT_154397 [Helobdella robusta]
MASNIPSCVHNATSKHTASVIFLHGLGDTGHGWLQAFKLIAQPHIKYICPTAHSIPVTLNCGMSMPSWFDIKSLSADAAEDEAGINSAADLVQSHIAAEEALGIPRSRIIIGGFSQGGAVALYSAFARAQQNLGGVLALSTWLPMHRSFPAVLKANQSVPILQCHGTDDTLIPFVMGKMTSEIVKQFDGNVQFKMYNGLGHSSCDEEMKDVKLFISEHLPPI